MKATLKIPRKILALLLLPLGLGGGCNDSPPSQGESPQIIVVGTSADNPPFETLKDGEIVGFDLDLMKLIAQKMGVQLKIQDMDFNGLIPALNAGHIDVAAATLTPSPERQKAVDFSRIYYKGSMALLSRASHKVTRFSDLAHKKLGVQLGTTWEQYAREQAQEVPGLELVPLNRNPQLVQELQMGRVDAVLLEEIQAKSFCENSPSLTFSVMAGAGSSFALAFRKNSPLASKIDKALEDLITSHSLDPLEKKWILQTP